MISLKSKIAQAVLGYFMLHEGAEMYVNELARRLSLESGNLARKLIELENEGLLQSAARGNQRYYALNPAFPLLKEYKQIVLKTVGLEKALRETLQSIKGVEKAYLFGSYAQNNMNTSSDIDLLAIGNHNTLELQKKIAEVQKSVDREINVISMSPSEYEKKRKRNSFLKSVHQEKKINLL